MGTRTTPLDTPLGFFEVALSNAPYSDSDKVRSGYPPPFGRCVEPVCRANERKKTDNPREAVRAGRVPWPKFFKSTILKLGPQGGLASHIDVGVEGLSSRG